MAYADLNPEMVGAWWGSPAALERGTGVFSAVFSPALFLYSDLRFSHRPSAAFGPKVTICLM
jgi:hypothetical protein